MVDLSFTQDPQWIEARKKVWLPIRKDLSDTSRKKHLDQLEHYVMTGDLDGLSLGDGSKFLYFPLQNEEGWDYVFQHLIKKTEAFEDIFYMEVFSEHHLGILSEQQELDLWDYFLGDTYEPIIRSRVPLKPTGEIYEMKVDCFRVVQLISSQLLGYCYSGKFSNQPKWIVKLEYFYSAFSALTEADMQGQHQLKNMCNLIEFLLDMAVHDLEPDERVDDPDQNREKFLQDFAEKMATFPHLPAAIQQIFEERRERLGV